jgi:hypothetical protein
VPLSGENSAEHQTPDVTLLSKISNKIILMRISTMSYNSVCNLYTGISIFNTEKITRIAVFFKRKHHLNI